MPRYKKPRTELIRVAPQPAIPDLATLDLLIQKRVAEAQSGALLEPWFPSRAVASEIIRQQGCFHRRKFALHFEKWGCLICGTKKKPHQSYAMCHACHHRFVERLRQIEKDYAKAHPHEYENQQIENLTSRIRNAERILGTARPVRTEE